MKENVIEIQEEIRIPQGDQELVLEKGDRLRVLERDVSTYKAPKGKSWDAVVKELERQGAESGKDYDLIGSENFWVSYKFDSPELQNILKKTSKKEVKMKKIIEIKEDISLKQDDKKIILEKGDKIQILKEDETLTWKEFKNRKLLHNSLSEFVLEVFYQKIKFNGVNAKAELVAGILRIVPARGNILLITPENSDIVTIYEEFNYGFKIQLDALGAVFYGYY
jgi:hypothetical protein